MTNPNKYQRESEKKKEKILIKLDNNKKRINK